jgi:hypothetical protein
MKKQFLHLTLGFTILALFTTHKSTAQNGTPYWSTYGNSNATSTSKLGTTNAINLRLFTNNVERVRITTSGLVGIGTTAPNARLHFDVPSGTSLLRGTVAGSTKLYMSSAGGLTVGAGLAAPSNGLYVAGKVGIGTATPSYKLQVVGSGLFTDALTINDGGLTATNATGNGVVGFGNSASAYGVFGSGYYGVYGQGSGYGLYGTGSTFGVYGVSGSSSGRGIYGECSGTYGYGGYFHGGSSGVFSTGGTYALYGSSNAGTGVYGYGNTYGIYGSTTYGWAGYFKGSVYSTGTYQGSDRKLKHNIIALRDAMDVISKLQPKMYEYRQDGAYKLMNLPQGKRYGLIAQEVEQILPSLVKNAEFDPSTGQKPESAGNMSSVSELSEKIDFKVVNYTELIPIMIKGMQELEAKTKEIEELKRKNEQLEQRLQRLETQFTSNGSNSLTLTSAYLEQNMPNPVSGTATIRYHVPETATSAVLNITNVKGQVVKTFTLSNRGTGQINLNTQALAAGTYNYTLYVDRKSVATKRLVVAR